MIVYVCIMRVLFELCGCMFRASVMYMCCVIVCLCMCYVCVVCEYILLRSCVDVLCAYGCSVYLICLVMYVVFAYMFDHLLCLCSCLWKKH